MTDIFVFNVTLTKEQVGELIGCTRFSDDTIQYLGEWWDLARTDQAGSVTTVPDDVADPTPSEWATAHNIYGARVRRWEDETGTHREFVLIDE